MGVCDAAGTSLRCVLMADLDLTVHLHMHPKGPATPDELRLSMTETVVARQWELRNWDVICEMGSPEIWHHRLRDMNSSRGRGLENQ